MPDETSPLSGGNMGQVWRRGATVIRDAGDWTPNVHRLLRHLNGRGVGGVPEPVEITEDDREVLTFLDGVVPAYPMPSWVWSAEAMTSAALLLRAIHDATTNMNFDGVWRSPTHEPVEVICHNDFAPHNLVFRGGAAIGAIDWDYASPGPRLWDLAYLAYRIVPLATADWGDHLDRAERDARLMQLLDHYGTLSPPAELRQVLRARLRELAEFSERASARLGNPALADHAALYRTDAENLF